MTGVYHYAQIFVVVVEIGVSQTFFQGWPETEIL
jgi:hypothetical protein